MSDNNYYDPHSYKGNTPGQDHGGVPEGMMVVHVNGVPKLWKKKTAYWVFGGIFGSFLALFIGIFVIAGIADSNRQEAIQDMVSPYVSDKSTYRGENSTTYYLTICDRENSNNCVRDDVSSSTYSRHAVGDSFNN